MFKGKVYMYSNINGKEEKLEREFDNPQDFQSFAGQVPAFQMLNRMPMFGLDGWNSLHNYLEDFLDKKLGLDYQSPDDQQSLIDLNKYEQALEEIEYNKTHKDARAKQLKTTLQKLKEYKKTFKEEHRDDFIGQIDEDIKKAEEELKKLE